MLDIVPDRNYGFSEELRERWTHYSPKPPLKDQALMLTVYPPGIALLLPLKGDHSFSLLMTGQWAILIICYTIFQTIPFKAICRGSRSSVNVYKWVHFAVPSSYFPTTDQNTHCRQNQGREDRLGRGLVLKLLVHLQSLIAAQFLDSVLLEQWHSGLSPSLKELLNHRITKVAKEL